MKQDPPEEKPMVVPEPDFPSRYPKGIDSIEMALVEMLNEHRSWHCYQRIASALQNVRRHAASMQRERDMMEMPEDNCSKS